MLKKLWLSVNILKLYSFHEYDINSYFCFDINPVFSKHPRNTEQFLHCHLILANIYPTIHYSNVHETKMDMGAERAIYLGLHKDITAIFGN